MTVLRPDEKSEKEQGKEETGEARFPADRKRGGGVERDGAG